MEVFAFAGILFGLWVWLTTKFLLNGLFTEGPQHIFKTKGVKFAKDQLVRNFNDAFIYTGLFWEAMINVFLLSSLNSAKDIILPA